MERTLAIKEKYLREKRYNILFKGIETLINSLTDQQFKVKGSVEETMGGNNIIIIVKENS